jgi:endonuclease III
LPKQDPATVKKFTALLKKVKSAYKGEDPPPRDPVAQLVVSFLQWNATRKQAEDAFTALMDQMIDVNDLRVSHPHELVAIIGEDYPDAGARVIRLREALHEVYVREHDIQMNSIAGKGKKEQRAYLDTLPGITPYIAAEVTLLSFGGHAMPVDEKLAALLIGEGCLDEDTEPAEAESHLARQVKAGDALEAHLALQSWADRRKLPAAADLESPTTNDALEAAEAVATAQKQQTTRKKKATRRKK